ncbi:alpha/beta fold hydrolase [Streptomyces luomodiensis]|uniref:Alpha/beta fold hydrolase n=1 Tax=Streptomyces luomodiensis TaxID=3026192 RepID=A0ABY9UW71_9ACTN|nr:alpha/beta fold hydrolase [Streptomyces sp. SCA4-21]WNE96778.1 alpha/beta fold hydrolase [Streptomyces sp. SCA4-21]
MATGFLAKAASAATLPVAPLYGAFLSYMIYHPPRRPHHKKPADMGLTSTDVNVPLDGQRGRGLHVWLIPGDTGRVVVLGHGLGLSKSASLAQARLLSQAGYTVALFDHRNHGKSVTDRAGWGMSDRHTDDVVAVVRHMRSMDEYATARIAIYGFSISTFPSFYMLGREDCPVDAVVCDSGPALELAPLFRNFVAAGGVPIPGPLGTGPSRPVVETVASSAAVAMLRVQWPPPAGGAYERTPMLFLAGERDTMIPAAGVRALAERYPLAEVHTLPDTEHLQGIKTQPDVYTDTVLGFLERTLKD